MYPKLFLFPLISDSEITLLRRNSNHSDEILKIVEERKIEIIFESIWAQYPIGSLWSIISVWCLSNCISCKHTGSWDICTPYFIPEMLFCAGSRGGAASYEDEGTVREPILLLWFSRAVFEQRSSYFSEIALERFLANTDLPSAPPI